MNRTYLNRFILALATTLALCGCSSSKVQSSTAATKNASSADAYAAEALAAYQLQRDGARSLMMINAAAQEAPKRADIAYLAVGLCRIIEGCAPEALEARLRKLDGGNAVVWMRALSAAQRQHDSVVEAQVLDAIGRSERFDIYWNSLAANITLARRSNLPMTEAALSETIGWLSAVVPVFQPLALACSRQRTGEQVWADRCRRVARVLMNGDTFIAESVGIALAQQTTADPPEIARLEQRARTSRYLWRTSADLIASQVERDKFAAEQLKLMVKLRREQEVQAAIVRWSGRPMTAPPGFDVNE